jgi:hypothetical protein
MLYVKEPFGVNKGENVDGVIVVRKNKTNPR